MLFVRKGPGKRNIAVAGVMFGGLLDKPSLGVTASQGAVHTSPGGATVDSRGRKPTECGDDVSKAPQGRQAGPDLGRFYRPSGALRFPVTLHPGLTPWAIDCRPSGTRKLLTVMHPAETVMHRAETVTHPADSVTLPVDSRNAPSCRQTTSMRLY